MTSSTPTPSSRGASAALCVVLLSSAVTFATPASGSLEQARAGSRQAQKAYDVGRFAEALEGFSKAYQLDPRPGILFNIAQCHRQLEDYESAAFAYRRYLAQYPKGRAPSAAVAQPL